MTELPRDRAERTSTASAQAETDKQSSPQSSASIDRRHLLRGGAVLATASLAGCDGPAEGGGSAAVHTGQRITWRLASSFPRSLDTIYGGAEVLAEAVEELSGGRFRIIAYPAGEIVPGLQVLDAVQAGTVQVGHTAAYYYTGKNPALAFDTAVPFGLTARQQNAWLYGEGGDAMRSVFSDFGILPFPCGNTGTQMGGWFRRQIETVSDLRGLKMRIPGLGARVLGELGVTVQTIAGGETYQALERGAVDAAEWVGPYDDQKLGFHKIAKNYYFPGWWEPGPNLSAMVSQKAWDALPIEYRQIFEAAAHKANVRMMAKYDDLNPGALETILAEGVAMRPFSEEILSACAQAANDMFQTEANADPAYRALYDAWSRYRKRSNEWFGTAEYGFARSLHA